MSSAPQAGDVFTIQNINAAGLNTANSGANQVWDYSAATDTGAPYTITAVAASATSHASSFSGATIALLSTASGDTGFSYSTVTSSTMTFLGSYINVAGSVTYSTPRVYFEYPLSYTHMFAHSFAAMSSNSDSITGVDSVWADGYGTVKLPGGRTYTNVLRLKHVQHFHSINTSFSFYENIDQTEYAYYIPSYHYFLCAIQYTTNDINGVVVSATTAQYSKGVSTGIEALRAETALLTLYPNPAHGAFTIATSDERLSGAKVSVFNKVGAEVLTGYLSATVQSFYLADAAPGLYTVQIVSASGSITRKLIIE
jgi:hypothetical protein